MKNSRLKGHNYERELAKTFREKGWVYCKTAREASGKLVDDSGRDLIDTEPFNIQAKNVETLGSAHNTLAKMPIDGRINVVFHRRNRKGVIVALSEEDFWKILDSVDLEKLDKGVCNV